MTGEATQAYVLRLALRASWCLAAVMLLLSAWVALTVPYHSWDALAFGEWSRLLAESGDFHPEGHGAATLHRPLFYTMQAGLWALFGFHEQIGRALALSFTVLLVLAVARLARGGRPAGLAGALAASLLFLHPDVLEGVADGLTDVPLAALVGVTASLALSTRSSRYLPWALGAAAAATALVKPPGLVALGCIAVAVALFRDGTSLGAVVRRRVAPLTAGAAAALVYHVVEAAQFDLGLLEFLRAGSDGFYASEARNSRAEQLLAFEAFGPVLRPLLLYALAYAIVRLARASHRIAVAVAAVLAPVLTIVLPLVAPGSTESTLDSGRGIAIFVVFGLTACFAWAAPPGAVPGRARLGALLVIGLLPYGVWLLYASYSSRLSSVAWPGLFALMGVTIAPGLVGLARRASVAALAPAVAVAVVCAYSYERIDGLRKDRWRELRTLSLGEWLDQAVTRDIAQPQLKDAVELAKVELGPAGRLISPSGEFRFYFPGRVTQDYPKSCAALAGHRVLVLLTDDGARAHMREVVGAPDDASYWAGCRSPKTTQLSDGAGGYAVFRVEA